MPELNERLSHWAALTHCFCGACEYVVRRGVPRWQRSNGERFGYVDCDGEPCKGCGYDTRMSPEETLKSLTAKDWSNCEVRGSCFYRAGEARAIMPDDVTGLVLRDCNLDNCILPKGATVEGGTHKNLWVQNDGATWVCDWVTDAPVAPLNLKYHIAEGLNTDPALIPAEKLTDEELKALEQARVDAKQLAEAETTVATLKSKLGIAEAVITDAEAVKG